VRQIKPVQLAFGRTLI